MGHAKWLWVRLTRCVVTIGSEPLAGGSVPNQDTYPILPTLRVWENPRDYGDPISNPPVAVGEYTSVEWLEVRRQQVYC